MDQAKYSGVRGNPKLISILGLSAGSACTHYLKLSPTTKDLIHRVISISGVALSDWAFEPNPRENAVMLANHLKCEARKSTEITSEEILSCLKNIPVEKLLQASTEFKQVCGAFSMIIF